MNDLHSLVPRFRWGTIVPAESHVVRSRGYQFYRIVPLDVLEITTVLGITDYTRQAVGEAIDRVWTCVDRLVPERPDRIVLGGAPVSAQLGRERVLALLADITERTGVAADAPLEAVVGAMKHLGARHLAIASRWDDELNARLVEYLGNGGIDVVGVTSRAQWAPQAFAMSLEEGLRLAVEVGREAARYESADAVYVAGGAAMALHVIDVIEGESARPVITNLSAEVWQGLVAPGVIPPVNGWGHLLTCGGTENGGRR